MRVGLSIPVTKWVSSGDATGAARVVPMGVVHKGVLLCACAVLGRGATPWGRAPHPKPSPPWGGGWRGCGSVFPLKLVGGVVNAHGAPPGRSRPTPAVSAHSPEFRVAARAMESLPPGGQAAPGELRSTGSSRGDGGAQTASPNIYKLLPIITRFDPR